MRAICWRGLLRDALVVEGERAGDDEGGLWADAVEREVQPRQGRVLTQGLADLAVHDEDMTSREDSGGSDR